MEKYCDNKNCVLYNEKKRNNCSGSKFEFCLESIVINPFYEKIDSQMKYLEDKQKIACLHGFKYVSEMIFELYENVCFNSPQIADIFEVSSPAIRYQLKEKMGCNMRSRGGCAGGNGALKLHGIYRNKYGTYTAWIHENGKLYLGSYKTIFMACWFRRCAEIKYGYTKKSTAQAYINANWRKNWEDIK